MTASARDTRNGEQSGKQAYIIGAEFSRVAISRIGIGGISSSELGVSSGIGGISSP